MENFRKHFDEKLNVLNESPDTSTDGIRVTKKELSKSGYTLVHNKFIDTKITEISGDYDYIKFYFTRGGEITLYANGRWEIKNGKERG